MKNKIITAVCCCIAMLALMQCSDSTGPDELDEIVLDVTLVGDEVYTYETGAGGDESGASIELQASNFNLSHIVRDSTTAWEAVYEYQTKTGYSGEDRVELLRSEGNGERVVWTQRIIIRFNIL